MGLHEDVIRHLTVHVDSIDEGPSPMMQKSGRDEEGAEAPEAQASLEGASITRSENKIRTKDTIWHIPLKATLAPGAGRRVFIPPSRNNPARYSGKGAPKIDYKDIKLLTRFISERGKMLPSRITSVSARKQRVTCPRHQTRPQPCTACLCREVRFCASRLQARLFLQPLLRALPQVSCYSYSERAPGLGGALLQVIPYSRSSWSLGLRSAPAPRRYACIATGATAFLSLGVEKKLWFHLHHRIPRALFRPAGAALALGNVKARDWYPMLKVLSEWLPSSPHAISCSWRC